MVIFGNSLRDAKKGLPLQELAVKSKNFYNKMAQRRSILEFSSEAICEDSLEFAIRTAGTAPSGANKQPWFFASITSQIIKDKLRVAAESVKFDFYSNKATAA